MDKGGLRPIRRRLLLWPTRIGAEVAGDFYNNHFATQPLRHRGLNPVTRTEKIRVKIRFLFLSPACLFCAFLALVERRRIVPIGCHSICFCFPKNLFRLSRLTSTPAAPRADTISALLFFRIVFFCLCPLLSAPLLFSPLALARCRTNHTQIAATRPPN